MKRTENPDNPTEAKQDKLSLELDDLRALDEAALSHVHGGGPIGFPPTAAHVERIGFPPA